MLIKLKTVYQIPLDPLLRSNIQMLLQSTQECATFLQFSSFASSNSHSNTRGPGPMSPAPSQSSSAYVFGTPPTPADGAPSHRDFLHNGNGNSANTTSPIVGLGVTNGLSGPVPGPSWRMRPAATSNASMTGVGAGVGMPFNHLASGRAPINGRGRPSAGAGAGAGGVAGYHSES